MDDVKVVGIWRMCGVRGVVVAGWEVTVVEVEGVEGVGDWVNVRHVGIRLRVSLAWCESIR